jgi:uncharacterized protein (TIGR02246 family)
LTIIPIFLKFVTVTLNQLSKYSLNQKGKTMARLIGIIILLAFSACAQQTEKPKIDLKAEEQAVKSLSMKWLELWESRDIESMTTLFVKDGVIYRPNQEPASGLTAIKDQFTKDFAQNPKLISSWNSERVDVSGSGDIAVEYGSWEDTQRGLDGTGDDHGRYITIYRKVNGIWKVAADFSLSTKPIEPAK